MGQSDLQALLSPSLAERIELAEALWAEVKASLSL